MNDSPGIKKEHGFAIKLLLFLSILIFLTIGGYSLYKIIIQKTTFSDEKVASLPEPTESIAVKTEKKPADLSPSPKIPETITVTTAPAAKPTNIPYAPSATPAKMLTPTATTKPTQTPSPKTTLAPTLQISPTPTKILQSKLPVSGNSIPTIFLFALGIFFLLPIICLR